MAQGPMTPQQFFAMQRGGYGQQMPQISQMPQQGYGGYQPPQMDMLKLLAMLKAKQGQQQRPQQQKVDPLQATIRKGANSMINTGGNYLAEMFGIDEYLPDDFETTSLLKKDGWKETLSDILKEQGSEYLNDSFGLDIDFDDPLKSQPITELKKAGAGYVKDKIGLTDFSNTIKNKGQEFLNDRFGLELGKETSKQGAKQVGGQISGKVQSAFTSAPKPQFSTPLQTDAFGYPVNEGLAEAGGSGANAGTAGTMSMGNVASGVAGAAGLGYGLHEGIKGIEAGDPLSAGMGGFGAGMGGAALASSLGAFGSAGIAGAAGAAGGLGGSLASMAAMGPYGAAAAAVMAAAAYGKQQRWGKGRKKLDRIRMDTMRDRMDELGLTVNEQGEAGGETGFTRPDGTFMRVGHGEKDTDRLKTAGDVNVDDVAGLNMNAHDRERFDRFQGKGEHFPANIDWTHKDMPKIVGETAPLSYLAAGHSMNDQQQIPQGYMTNALRGADDEQRKTWLKDKYKTLGHESAQGVNDTLGDMFNQGAISQWQALSGQNAANQTFAEEPQVNPGGEGWIHESHRDAYTQYMQGEAAKLKKSADVNFIDDEGKAIINPWG